MRKQALNLRRGPFLSILKVMNLRKHCFKCINYIRNKTIYIYIYIYIFYFECFFGSYFNHSLYFELRFLIYVITLSYRRTYIGHE